MWHKWHHFLRKSLIFLLFELSVFKPEVWPSSYHIIFYFKQDSRFISWYYFTMGSANIIKCSHIFSHTSKLYFFLWFSFCDSHAEMQINTTHFQTGYLHPSPPALPWLQAHRPVLSWASAAHEHKSMEITSHRSLAGASSNTQLSQNTHVSYFTNLFVRVEV